MNKGNAISQAYLNTVLRYLTISNNEIGTIASIHNIYRRLYFYSNSLNCVFIIIHLSLTLI